MSGLITRSMLTQSRSVGDPRWSPSATRLAWVQEFDGRDDVVVADAAGGPPIVVTADCGVNESYSWASDDELLVTGAHGRLVVVAATGGVVRELTRDGMACNP